MALSPEEAVANRVRPIALSDADRAGLERLYRASSTPAGLSRRVRTVLLMGQGLTGVEIAERVGYTAVQVSRLRRRFAETGVAGLYERPRSGRPPTITARQRARVVALTLKLPGGGRTHWTTRDLARESGLSHSSVHRRWRAHALQPHRVESFKFTADPAAEDKIYDVVGLYLNPPSNAVGAEPRREDPDSSPQPHPTAAAAAPRVAGSPNARLRPSRPDEPLCRLGGRDRPCARRVRAPATPAPSSWRSSSSWPGA